MYWLFKFLTVERYNNILSENKALFFFLGPLNLVISVLLRI